MADPINMDISRRVKRLMPRYLKSCPWDGFKYNPGPVFRAGIIERDGKPEYLVLAFFVQREVIRAEHKKTNSMVCEDSCVEFFFKAENDENYYNLEFNALGTAHIAYGPDRHTRALLNPELIESTVKTVASVTDADLKAAGIGMPRSWSLTVRIHTSLFVDFSAGLGPLLETGIRANVYKCGDLTVQPHYVTLFPVGTAEPDYHRPEFFQPIELGVLKPTSHIHELNSQKVHFLI